MGSFDPNDWFQCDWCEWWGYFGPNVPGKFLLYDIDCAGGSLPLCMRCEAADWEEVNRIHFRYCCGKGFGPDDWFQCTSCGWWGYFAEYVPNKCALEKVYDRDHEFQLLCKQCIEFVELPLQASRGAK